MMISDCSWLSSMSKYFPDKYMTSTFKWYVYSTWIVDSGKDVYHQKMKKILKTDRPKPNIGSLFENISQRF